MVKATPSIPLDRLSGSKIQLMTDLSTFNRGSAPLISNWHSEPYHQNQSPAEWRYRTIKSWTNTVMNRSGAPANCWLLFLIYVFYLLNHIACAALDGFSVSMSLCSMQHMVNVSLLKMKRQLATWLALGSIVVMP